MIPYTEEPKIFLNGVECSIQVRRRAMELGVEGRMMKLFDEEG